MKIRITIYLFIPEALIFYPRLDTVLGNWDITRNKLEEEKKAAYWSLVSANTVPGAVG